MNNNDERDYAEEAANAALMREEAEEDDIDPDQAHRRIGAAIRRLRQRDIGEFSFRLTAARLIDEYQALDRWMSRGGQSPRAWMAEEERDIAQLAKATFDNLPGVRSITWADDDQAEE